MTKQETIKGLEEALTQAETKYNETFKKDGFEYLYWVENIQVLHKAIRVLEELANND